MHAHNKIAHDKNAHDKNALSGFGNEQLILHTCCTQKSCRQGISERLACSTKLNVDLAANCFFIAQNHSSFSDVHLGMCRSRRSNLKLAQEGSTNGASGVFKAKGRRYPTRGSIPTGSLADRGRREGPTGPGSIPPRATTHASLPRT